MTILHVASRNLLRKRTRSLLTVIGIALSSWVLVSLLGFNRGYEGALSRDIDAMGFQFLVTAKGCPYEAATMMLTGGAGLRYLSEAVAEQVAREPDVEAVTPMLMQAVFNPDQGDSGGLTAFLGVEPATYPSMKSYMRLRQGRWFTDPQALEVVMGYEVAELEQREAGDMIVLPEQDVQLRVVGILERTGTQDDGTVFVPIAALQGLFARQGQITALGIRLDQGADMAAFEERLYALPEAQVVSLAQVKQTIMNLVSTARVMVLSIAAIAVVIAMVGVVNTVLMSVVERIQEIGILKTMGAMPLDISRLVMLEALILCTAGGTAGVAAALLLAGGTGLLVRRLLPYAPAGGLIQIDAALAGGTLVAILVIGLASGAYPAWRAGRVRPLAAIRGEVAR